MLNMNSTLLNEIDEFLSETGMTPYRFGFLAVKNGRLVERLRAGATPKGKPVRIWPDTEKQIRKFMRAERSRREVAA
jgi:hypothetical protein